MAINQGGNRKDKVSYSSAKCSFVSAKCSKSTASQNLLLSVYCFLTVSISGNRCAKLLLRYFSATVTSVVRRLFISRKGAKFIYLLSKCEKLQISSLKIVYSLTWWRTPKELYRRSPTLQARWMSILFQANRNYSESVCVRSGFTLVILCIWRCRTASLVYLKFFSQVGRFSWATLGFSRGRDQLFSWSWWQRLLDVLDSNILQYSSWCLSAIRYFAEVCLRIYSYDWLSTICCC